MKLVLAIAAGYVVGEVVLELLGMAARQAGAAVVRTFTAMLKRILEKPTVTKTPVAGEM